MSFEKTYSITLRFGTEGDSLKETDQHSVEMRAKIIKWIEGKVAHVSQGMLSIHIVGEISET